MSKQDDAKKTARVVAGAWTDPAYLARLRADPKAVLAEAGLKPGSHVKLVEDSDSVQHFLLPKKPAHIVEGDLKKNPLHPDFCSTAADFCST